VRTNKQGITNRYVVVLGVVVEGEG